MRRQITPAADLRALLRFIALLARERFDIVDVHTPKASLLGSLAGWMTGVSCRFYTQHGLRYEGAVGLKRTILMGAERITCLSVHRVISISPSVQRRAIADGIVCPLKCTVLANGSINGLLSDRFVRQWTPAQIYKARESLGIPPDCKLVGFIGRLEDDKGITDLIRAVEYLRKKFGDVELLLIGGWDETNPVPLETKEIIRRERWIHAIGPVNTPEDYYGVIDVLGFATRREGFPTVPLEAGAAGVPTVGYRVTGVVDAVVEGITGLLVAVGDWRALAEAMAELLSDPTRRADLGHNAQRRLIAEFKPEGVWAARKEEYLRMIGIRNRKVDTPGINGDGYHFSN
jgi:glycosyltransferase involved in cell wall biosynthesis